MVGHQARHDRKRDQLTNSLIAKNHERLIDGSDRMIEREGGGIDIAEYLLGERKIHTDQILQAPEVQIRMLELTEYPELVELRGGDLAG